MKQSKEFDSDNLFCLINGFSKNNIAGMIQEFRYLPVVVLKFSERPEKISENCFLLKECDILMMGEVINYETCMVRMIQYSDF